MFPPVTFKLPIEYCDFDFGESHVYTGSPVKPKVVGSYDGRPLTADIDFSVSYKNNDKVGEATMTINGMGSGYTGSQTFSFDICPEGTEIDTIKALKNGLRVSWEPQDEQTTGYQIRYSDNRDMEDAETVTIKDNTMTYYDFTDLNPRRHYFFQIRTYTKIGDDKFRSSWSSKEMSDAD